MGRSSKNEEFVYECVVIDSGSDEASLLRDLYGLSSDFLIGEFSPQEIKKSEHDRILDFTEQVIDAWVNGNISTFAKEHATIPPTMVLARMAQEKFFKESGLTKIDPFFLDKPGDVLREISRNIEWELFREYQRRANSVKLVNIILGGTPQKFDEKSIIRQVINNVGEIDTIMLSASQQRKSRAGYSYEHHIEAALIGGDIPFEKQVIIEAKKRPDFILPSLKFLNSGQLGADAGLI